MLTKYEEYQHEMIEKVHASLYSMSCLPILFVGTGLSIRHFGAPSWKNLLEMVFEKCPQEMGFAYYCQDYKDLIDLGEFLTDVVRKWAWSKEGKSYFPAHLFTSSIQIDAYIKHMTADIISSMCRKTKEEFFLQDEIKSLGKIQPHAIITTNYDNMMELLFPEYEVIVGEKVLRNINGSIGEIFKIHGCQSQPDSIVLNRKDYNKFNTSKKYLSAKLLAYFAEHPLLFVGYSVSDPNIIGILSDIDEILARPGGLVDNIFIIIREEEIDQNRFYPTEAILNLGGGKTMRVNCIHAKDFSWIYESFSSQTEHNKINVKILRLFLANAINLVRKEIPKNQIAINYVDLSNKLESANQNDVLSVYGISVLDGQDTTKVNITHPYITKEIAQILGISMHEVQKIIAYIEKDKGKKIKDSDNIYHIRIQSGKSYTRKYSEEAVRLFRKVKNRQPYEIYI